VETRSWWGSGLSGHEVGPWSWIRWEGGDSEVVGFV
jgi:hypothetical protein